MRAIVIAAAASCLLLTGCISMAIGAVGVAADVAIGAVKLTGKAVGAAADLVIPDKEEKK
ncbi:MAG: hypothetical protein HY854_21710 [Burkholderiales bacterium]|nr:hypothetical protein [Burkholderiales bacterium]